jgi:hypothetical protein
MNTQNEKTIDARVLPSGELLTGKFRVSFPHVFEPSAARGSDREEYSIKGMIPKSDPSAKALNEYIRAAIVARWPKGRPAGEFRSPMRDGDAEGEREEYKGCWVVTLKSGKDRPPKVVDRLKKDIIDPERIYAGCWCRAVISAYAYDNLGRGVRLNLNLLQFVDDGERIASGAQGAGVDALDDLPPQAAPADPSVSFGDDIPNF